MKVELTVKDIQNEREQAIAHKLKKMIDDLLRFLEELDRLNEEEEEA